MSHYRNALPQLSEQLFLTDGGLETTLVFHHGIDLPYFAAIDLLRTRAGCEILRDYYRRYAAIAAQLNVGFIFESATWRASSDWADKLDYSDQRLESLNRKAVALLEGVRAEYPAIRGAVISGCVGPRGDGYRPAEIMNEDQAQRYHARQIGCLGRTAADMVSAMTIGYAAEAIGIVRAAQYAGLPSSISFTVETDGRLPNGQSLADAIEEVDAATGNGPAYYMINCAHPSHFADVLDDADWVRRVRGIRANASCLSHAELDEAETLDDGDPVELGEQYRQLTRRFGHLNVLGGCCGTDHRHVAAVAHACAA